MIDVIWKVRRNSDGLYSNGGSSPHFTKRGKVWRRRGDLHSHLGQLHNESVYMDCEIMEFEVHEIASDSWPAHKYTMDYLAQRAQERAISDAERKLEYLQRRKDEAERDLRRVEAELACYIPVT